jgi:hypothetical protein
MSVAQIIEAAFVFLMLAVAFTVLGMRLSFWLLRRGNFRNGG